MKSAFIKIAFLVAAVVLMDICIFSPGILGYSLLSGPVFTRLAAFLAILATVVLLGYGVWTLLPDRNDQPALQNRNRELKPEEVRRLYEHTQSRIYSFQLKQIGKYLDRLEKKREATSAALQEAFPAGSLTYQKYESGLKMADQNVLHNLDSALRRIRLLDDEEYSMAENARDRQFLQENADFISNELNDARTTLQSLDRLQLELSNLPFKEDEKKEEAARQELDELISGLHHYS